MSFASIEGARIEYDIIEPSTRRHIDIVMLHEGLGSLAMWKAFPHDLAKTCSCRVLVYSRLGYGQSDSLSKPRNVTFLHDEARIALPAILKLTGFKRPILFGHSDGASIALIYASLYPHAPAGLIVLSPHVKVEELTIASISRAKVAYETTGLRSKLARYHRDVDSAFWGWNRVWLDSEFRSWNIETLLPAIRCPVIAMQGYDDHYGTMEQVDAIGGAIAGTRVLKLATCGHSPHINQPATVLAATREFAERLSARHAPIQ